MGATEPGVAMGAMTAPDNRRAEKKKPFQKKYPDIQYVFPCSLIRLESAHNRPYVTLMSFLLWVIEKNLSALFCYLLGV